MHLDIYKANFKNLLYELLVILTDVLILYYIVLQARQIGYI